MLNQLPLPIINAYILAGGKSSRMGQDKGLLRFRNKYLIEHSIEKLKPLVKNIVLVTNDPAYKQFGLSCISDNIKDAGAAGGIHAAMMHSDTPLNFVLSCDMPLISTEGIQYMIAHSAGTQITVPVYKQKLEPLFGVYASACAEPWADLIQKGTFKLQVLIDHFSTLKIHVDDETPFHETFFTNINTPTDLDNLLKSNDNEH